MGLVPLDKETGKPLKDVERGPVRDAGVPKETDMEFLPLEKKEIPVKKSKKNK